MSARNSPPEMQSSPERYTRCFLNFIAIVPSNHVPTIAFFRIASRAVSVTCHPDMVSVNMSTEEGNKKDKHQRPPIVSAQYRAVGGWEGVIALLTVIEIISEE
ncbi:hypothetical protein BgiMline_024759 [Biomphalaria glabrata]|nr:hypothetical protein BgiMline_007931 [Biomphalaria glabrata]